MSGIAGHWQLDGRPADHAGLQGMLRCLAHRGPDGEGRWCDQVVGLGHLMLHTTSESLAERLPLANREGTVALTCDARIDNRDELIATLGLGGRPPYTIPDGELILAAYEKWAAHCPEHMTGDFAFALWDRRAQRLFCARDHFGIKPFYYHHQAGRLFAFASEIKALLRLPGMPRRLNETRVGDFLQSSFDDEEATFYEGIRRLPPAHAMMVSAEGVELTRYWDLDPEREVVLGTREEYAEAFRDIFSEAVRCRLRSAFPIGSTLSGGLDSSSIVCTARSVLRQQHAAPLHTFSIVFDALWQCDERPFINAVLEGGDLVPHLVGGDRLSPLEDLEIYLRYEDEASWVVNMCLHWAMHRAAAAEGVRVFLDGLGGDDVVCHGLFHLAELLRAGRWLELAVSAKRLGTHFHRSPLWILKRHAIRPLVPARWLDRWSVLRGRPAHARHAIHPLITAEFADRTSLGQRLQCREEAQPHAPNTLRGSHYLGLRSGIVSAGFESIDRVAAAFSLEPRYPFHDRRLVEFCLALPADQKLSWGWTRVALRNAMEGVLPERVRWRAGKADLTAQFTRSFLAFERERIEGVVYDRADVIAPFVDLTQLRRLYRDYAGGGNPQNAALIWRPVMLGLWLERAAFVN